MFEACGLRRDWVVACSDANMLSKFMLRVALRGLGSCMFRSRTPVRRVRCVSS